MPDSQNTTGTDATQARGGQGFPADNPRTGEPGLIGKDDFTRQYEIGRLERGRVEVLAGNYADLQRIGAQLADNNAKGVISKEVLGVPPGVDPSADNVVTPAQHDALKGEWTVESERAGLVSAPPDPIPAENRDPDSIDPTSTSPQSVSKSQQTSTAKPGGK